MDFSFTEDQNALRDLARKILEDHVTHDRLKQVEAQPDWFDRAVWGELAKANLLGVSLPEDAGGSGLGLIELCVLLAEVGRVVAAIPALPALVLGALPIAEFGTAEQRQRYLPGVANGTSLLTAALIEVDNEEPARPLVTAKRDGANWRLDGIKTCVPAAHLAERLLVPARTGERTAGMFLVDPRAAGVELTRQQATNHEPQCRMTLSGALVTGGDVLGDPTGGAAIADWTVARALLGLCALQAGVTERAVQMTADYTKTREQFGRPIGSFQAVAHRAADMYIDAEAIRLTMWQAAWRLAAGLPAAEELAIAKFWAAEAGHRVVYAAQHLHGGIGVDIDYPIHRYLLWAKAIELTLGGATAQLLRLGAAMAQAA
ncbi:MAG: acyl-CoA/acyl-ACP dehydrogenase [Deltaproteobacteria bacterium]|nr:acyl-CoA/acyl-ACP dehydrogenase [Deltaproteobacteria bacterium]